MKAKGIKRYVMSALSLGISDGVHVQMLAHDATNALHEDAELWAKGVDVRRMEATLEACIEEMCAYEISKDPNDHVRAIVNEALDVLGRGPLK